MNKFSPLPVKRQSPLPTKPVSKPKPAVKSAPPIHQAKKINKQAIDKQALERSLLRQIQQEQSQRAAQRRQIQQIAFYKQQLLQHISQHWRIPPHVNHQLRCELQLKVAADGTVLQVEIIHSSGNLRLDRSAEIAVLKASPLPVPQNQKILRAFRSIHLIVQPEQMKRTNSP